MRGAVVNDLGYVAVFANNHCVHRVEISVGIIHIINVTKELASCGQQVFTARCPLMRHIEHIGRRTYTACPSRLCLPQKRPFPWGIHLMHGTLSHLNSQFHIPNSMSIGSAVSATSKPWPTDRHTDTHRQRHSTCVAIDRLYTLHIYCIKYAYTKYAYGQRTGINGESTSMVRPTLGSRTAKEQALYSACDAV